jgi:hypothetical protein
VRLGTNSTDPALPTTLPGKIQLSGLIDGYYSFNNNHPASRSNTLRNFEVKANQFSLTMVKLSLTRSAEPVGFTLDLGFGRAWQIFHVTDPAGTDVVHYIPQACISVSRRLGWLSVRFRQILYVGGRGVDGEQSYLEYGRCYLYTNGP